MGVLGLGDDAEEAAVAVDEVVLVAEAPRVPLELALDGCADRVDVAVEDDRPLQHGVDLVLDRDVLDAELVLARRAEHEPEVPERLLEGLEILLQVDVAAGDAELLAREDDLGRGIPDAEGDLDVVLLADGRVRLGKSRVLSRGRAGSEQQEGAGRAEAVKRAKNLHTGPYRPNPRQPVGRMANDAKRRPDKSAATIGRCSPPCADCCPTLAEPGAPWCSACRARSSRTCSPC